MTTVNWAQIAGIQDVATAGSSAVNAATFIERAARTRGPRRAAALLLAGLFAAIAVSALGHLGLGGSGLEVALRTPLLLTDVAVTAVLAMGARR